MTIMNSSSLTAIFREDPRESLREDPKESPCKVSPMFEQACTARKSAMPVSQSCRLSPLPPALMPEFCLVLFHLAQPGVVTAMRQKVYWRAPGSLAPSAFKAQQAWTYAVPLAPCESPKRFITLALLQVR